MKYCTNCGNELKPGAKFCTSCGAKIVNDSSVNSGAVEDSQTSESTSVSEKIQSQNDTTQKVIDSISQQVSQINTEHVKSYWTWLVEAWKTPMKVSANSNKYYGLVTIIIEAVLFNLALVTYAYKGISGVESLASKFMLTNDSSADFGGSVQTFLTGFVIITLAALVMIGANYAVCKIFSDFNSDFMELTNTIAHRSALIVIFNFIIYLFSLISNADLSAVFDIKIIVILLGLILLIWSLSIISTSFELNNSKIDNIYVGFINWIVIVIIYYVVIRFTILKLLTSFMHMF